MYKKRDLHILIILALLLLPQIFLLAQSRLAKSVLSNGAGASYSSDIQLNSTIGQTIIGVATNSSDSCKIGFWYIKNNLVVDISQSGITLPVRYELFQNYPNPFNPSTRIKFALPEPELVKIDIFNIIGQQIETLLHKSMPAGYHEIEIMIQNLPTGIYLYKIQAGDFRDVKKMILVK